MFLLHQHDNTPPPLKSPDSTRHLWFFLIEKLLIGPNCSHTHLTDEPPTSPLHSLRPPPSRTRV